VPFLRSCPVCRSQIVTEALLPAADEAAVSTTGAGMDPVVALSDIDAGADSNQSASSKAA